MTIKQLLILVFALVIIIPVFGRAVSAHHSQAGFATIDKAMVLKGTVAEFRWRNPHVLLFWDVKDDTGKTVRWAGELSSVNSSIGDGLTKNSFKPGEEIVVTGIPSKAGTPECLIVKIEKADGTVVKP